MTFGFEIKHQAIISAACTLPYVVKYSSLPRSFATNY